MGKIIVKSGQVLDVKRESGFLYYCGTDKNGNIVVGRAEMARGRKTKKKSKKKKKR